MSEVLELFGEAPSKRHLDWQSIIRQQACPYLNRTCIKVRKSQPEVAIGTCSVSYGKAKRPMLICPFRLLENKQIFVDCFHLLLLHEPGNELHIVPEVGVPGGNVDYFLASVRDDRVRDFVGLELQTMDTTGTIWPARQRFLEEVVVEGVHEDQASYRTYGMNWKMTAKTTLVQLHHKIQTFEAVNKHLVLVTQDHLLNYLCENFEFDHVVQARQGDSMQFHAYQFRESDGVYSMQLASRSSTDSEGLAICLGLKAEPKIELDKIIEQIERKVSRETLFKL